MESWENIILQWTNCLNESSDEIKTVEDLQDGKIYYSLINRIIPWNSKKSNKSQRDMVLAFLKDEYPQFPLKNENSSISKLCIATLLLSRLSLESIFHKMLCTNLDVDIHIKIKSVLETVYSLDKSITEEDLYKIFSLSTKKSHELLNDTKSIVVLDEFIETPVTDEDEDVQLELTKQIRQLKLQIQTMEYEKSNLTEDIAAQEMHIKDLNNKLQEALLELRMARADSFVNNTSIDSKDGILEKSIKKECQKEGSLEKCINKLQADNNQLEDQKKALVMEIKQLYTEKYQELKENNENKKKTIELMMLTRSQERKIKDLQNKLQVALCASNATHSAEDLSKFKGLEKAIMKLKTINYHLEQEKQAFVVDELKLYKEKHLILKEKNENKRKAYEAVKLIKSQEKQIKNFENKLKNSEKNIERFKTKIHQFYQEKRALIDELKLYKGKNSTPLVEKSEKIEEKQKNHKKK